MMTEEIHPSDLVEAACGGDLEEIMKLLDESSIDQSMVKGRHAGRLNTTDGCGNTALHLAVYRNHDVAIRTLINAGANIDFPNKCEMTPLIVAAGQGRPSCLRELIHLGADIHYVNSRGGHALMLAAINGQEECLQLLIEAGADLDVGMKMSPFCEISYSGPTALMCAALYHRVTCLKLLLLAGSDVNIKTSGGETALHFACDIARSQENLSSSDIVECVRTLVEAESDVNVQTLKGDTALMYTIRCGSTCRNIDEFVVTECVKVLIDFGADVMKRNSEEETVLMLAAKDDRFFHLLPIFVKAGAIVDSQDSSGMTALAHAVSTGSYECVHWLVDSGASVNSRDCSGKTPLHYLMFLNDNDQIALRCLEVLLQKQANVNATDKDGMTPLMYVAREPEGTNTMATLLQHGAEVNLVDFRQQSALIHSFQSLLETCFWSVSGVTDQRKNVRLLLYYGADIRIGKLAAGRLSNISSAILPHDFNFMNLQVGNAVDLEAHWDDFESVIGEGKKNILLFLIINGVMPSQQKIRNRSKRFPPNRVTSLLELAVKKGYLEITNYLVATCYLRSADLTFASARSLDYSVESDNQEVVTLIENLRRQPWPLVKLCFVAVSTAFGASPGRQERVKNSQLPVKLQKMLLFQEPWSRLCVHQWDKMPLTFSPEKYEKLPRPRPLLYYWPVGLGLVPCDCGKCDGTMYIYENSKEVDENQK